jgi:hypothetical protein
MASRSRPTRRSRQSTGPRAAPTPAPRAAPAPRPTTRPRLTPPSSMPLDPTTGARGTETRAPATPPGPPLPHARRHHHAQPPTQIPPTAHSPNTPPKPRQPLI